MINGTQLITALGVEALSRAELIAKQADVVSALALEVLQGTPKAFDYGKLTLHVCMCVCHVIVMLCMYILYVSIHSWHNAAYIHVHG